MKTIPIIIPSIFFIVIVLIILSHSLVIDYLLLGIAIVVWIIGIKISIFKKKE